MLNCDEGAYTGENEDTTKTSRRGYKMQRRAWQVGGGRTCNVGTFPSHAVLQQDICGSCSSHDVRGL